MLEEQRIPSGLTALHVEAYPDSDGLPMTDGDRHYQAIQSIRSPLEIRHLHSKDTSVTGDLLLYFRRHDPSKTLAPDVTVVLETPRHQRMNYQLWKGGRLPHVVVEVSSPDSFEQDRGTKKEIYGRLGIPEHFLFRPIMEAKRMVPGSCCHIGGGENS